MVKKLIAEGGYASQSALLEALALRGFRTTQATLSRDMSALGIVRRLSAEGHYEYALPEKNVHLAPQSAEQQSAGLRQLGVESVSLGGALFVVKTRAGFASAVALRIDEAGLPSILGTVAGDDTVIVVVRQGVDEAEAVSLLSSL